MRPWLALLLSAAAGYVSLSQEILWFRVISYATGGAPTAFAHLLGGFLLGLAAGALAAHHLAQRPIARPALLLGGLFLATTLTGYFSIPSTARMFTLVGPAATAYAYLMVALVAFPGGVLFPLLCQYGIRSSQAVGLKLSGLYLANVLGSTLGPLVTTFVLMDLYPFPGLAAVVCGVAWVAAALAALALPAGWGERALFGGGLAAAAVLVALSHATQYELLLERLHFKQELEPGKPYRHLVQTRSGIVAVGGGGEDLTIWGGGVFDGAFNVDPVHDINGIRRAYLVAALHRNPEEVLEIGLSSGSWARVLANHRAVKSLTSVEIDPGYLEVIRRFPDQASLLSDPKLTLHIDDGRRWLMRNPDRKFDFILMNTTFHWRSHASNLLSEELFQLCKRHLKPGGVLYLNTTRSDDVRYTAAQVFRHAVRVEGFIAVSDAPFDMTVEERRRNLLGFELHGRPAFSPELPESERVLQELATWPLADEAEALRRRTELIKITDDNMATEYKTRFRWMDPERSWGRLFTRLAREAGH